ncbi:hypothetical protein [Eudoraea sp.]|uniref:hypothetical protein n=1 Tax=Eudoraea sp. TaxID=1979955 RepID=UPI003C72163A
MKNAIYLVLALLIVSCSATNTANSQSAAMKKKTLKGTWSLTDIRFIGEEGLYKADLFGIADSPCFKGGEWMFIPNNGTGRFSINGTDRCQEGTHRILWSFYEPGDGSTELQFKLVDTKNKPLSGDKSGYRMTIKSLTETKTVFMVEVDYKGKPFDVELTLDKVSKDVTL